MPTRFAPLRPATAVLAATVGLAWVAPAQARDLGERPTLLDYKEFRGLALDLTGRLPSEADLAAFESTTFDLDAWIDARLTEPAVADRIAALYIERLRIGVPEELDLTSTANQLLAVPFRAPDGTLAKLYYRFDQRRTTAAIDRRVCLTDDEIGYTVRRYYEPGAADQAAAKPLDPALFASRVVKVRPWWNFRDWDNADPSQPLIGDAANDGRFAWLGWDEMPETEVYVCREEAQSATEGTVTGGPVGCGGAADPCKDGVDGHWDTSSLSRILAGTDGAKPLPAGAKVDCRTGVGREFSAECGCGPGLSYCLPTGSQCESCGYFRPILRPLDPYTSFGFPRWERRRSDWWVKFWWIQELRTTIRELILRDGDFREVLTGKGTYVNGPLAWYYGEFQRAPYDLAQIARNGAAELPFLFDPARAPAMNMHADADWRAVADRGPQASGILTSAAFLHRYAARRGRAHAVYQVFRCEAFNPPPVPIVATLEPNLMKASGCSTCHITLEPMSSYFARTPEAGGALSPMTWLDPARFPASTADCKLKPRVGAPGYGFRWESWTHYNFCSTYYDGPLADGTNTPLLGTYGSPPHAEMGPAGLAAEVLAQKLGDGSSQYAACVTKTVADAWLGRKFDLGADELASAAAAMEQHGYSVRAMLRALVKTSAYRFNNMSSDVWRGRGQERP